jgi:hypothetical protein
MSRKKQIEITEEMLAQINKIAGADVDVDQIVVFEAAAASTREISKMGSMYHGARMSRSLLVEMADGLNSGTESVPLHTLHMQGSEIPKGRVFHGSVVDEVDGSSTLRTLFYLPLAEKELIEKINLAILDEVSVGVKSEQALCSTCGFDYFGPEGDFENYYGNVCNNGHVIGENGTHLKLVGMEKWMELSLVSRGASDNAKILGRVKRLVSQADQDRMAADGQPIEAVTLFTSMSLENLDMPKAKTAAELAAEAAAAALALENEGGDDPAEFDMAGGFAALGAQLSTLVTLMTPAATVEDPTVESLTADLETSQARIAELEAEAAATLAETEAAEAEAARLAALAAEEIETPPGGAALSATTEGLSNGKPAQGRTGTFRTKRPRS